VQRFHSSTSYLIKPSCIGDEDVFFSEDACRYTFSSCVIPNPYLIYFTMALGSSQRLTEISTGMFLGGKGRPARKADNLIAICEPIV
jgi:hypothetical protein